MRVCFLPFTSWRKPPTWKYMRSCLVAHSLSLSHLRFHLIKIYIYVRLLVHWMCQWSEYTWIIYKYALIIYIYIYIYKNFIWFFFTKNYIRILYGFSLKKLYKKEKTSRKRRNYTLLRVYASFLSQAGGTHSWWVPPIVIGEKHTPIIWCIFSRERPCDSVMWCFVRVIFHLTLHLNFFTYFGL